MKENRNHAQILECHELINQARSQALNSGIDIKIWVVSLAFEHFSSLTALKMLSEKTGEDIEDVLNIIKISKGEVEDIYD